MSLEAVVAKALAEGSALIAKAPASTVGSVIEALKAIVAGEPTKAERLARNAALAVAAKLAVKARIKATKR